MTETRETLPLLTFARHAETCASNIGRFRPDLGAQFAWRDGDEATCSCGLSLAVRKSGRWSKLLDRAGYWTTSDGNPYQQFGAQLLFEMQQIEEAEKFPPAPAVSGSAPTPPMFGSVPLAGANFHTRPSGVETSPLGDEPSRSDSPSVIDNSKLSIPMIDKKPSPPAPETVSAPPQVAGDVLTITLAQFEHRCRVAIGRLQDEPNGDSSLIGLLCEGVRLARECGTHAPSAPETVSAPPTERCFLLPDADSPDCAVHDELCDWVECTGWRCPASGQICSDGASGGLSLKARTARLNNLAAQLLMGPGENAAQHRSIRDAACPRCKRLNDLIDKAATAVPAVSGSAPTPHERLRSMMVDAPHGGDVGLEHPDLDAPPAPETVSAPPPADEDRCEGCDAPLGEAERFTTTDDVDLCETCFGTVPIQRVPHLAGHSRERAETPAPPVELTDDMVIEMWECMNAASSAAFDRAIRKLSNDRDATAEANKALIKAGRTYLREKGILR